MKSFRAAALLTITLGLGLSACAPRMVTQISGSKDQVKFVYFESKFFSARQGIVQCTVDKYGYVEQCADMNIEFHD